MKQIKLIAILLFFGGMMVLYNGCKDDECPDVPCDDPTNWRCPNFDPCLGKREINSFFRMRPGDNGFPPPESWCDLIPTDTMSASSVRFDIPLGNPGYCRYEWQIGSEPSLRHQPYFEIDFSDYIREVGWETHIPITLTIVTPPNECLNDLNDTIITVTRNLFFSKKVNGIYGVDDTIRRSLIGYLVDDPNNIFELDIYPFSSGYFNYEFLGGVPKFFLGFPFADSILLPHGGAVLRCQNFKHVILTYYNRSPHSSKIEALSKGLIKVDFIYRKLDEWSIILEFDEKSKLGTKHFIGRKL